MAETEAYLVQGRYNEAFSLPYPSEVDTEKLITYGGNSGSRQSDLDSITFKIRIEAHPGYRVSIVENHIRNTLQKTEFEGDITLFPEYAAISDPQSHRGSLNHPRYYFLPFGDAKVEIIFDTDNTKHLRATAKRIPHSISARFPGIWEYTQDQTNIYLLQGNKVITGISASRNVNPRNYDLVVNQEAWRTIEEASWASEHRTMLLPNNPEFWKTLRVVVGDKIPEPTA